MGFSFNGLSGAAVTISGNIQTTTPDLPSGATPFSVYLQMANNTDYQSLVAASGTKRIFLTALSIDNGAAAGFRLSFDGGTTPFIHWRQNTGAQERPPVLGNPIAVSAAGQALTIRASVGSTHDVWARGFYLD